MAQKPAVPEGHGAATASENAYYYDSYAQTFTPGYQGYYYYYWCAFEFTLISSILVVLVPLGKHAPIYELRN